MANFSPELQNEFDDIIKEIQVALDPTKSESIIARLKELWEEIKSADSDQ